MIVIESRKTAELVASIIQSNKKLCMKCIYYEFKHTLYCEHKQIPAESIVCTILGTACTSAPKKGLPLIDELQWTGLSSQDKKEVTQKVYKTGMKDGSKFSSQVDDIVKTAFATFTGDAKDVVFAKLPLAPSIDPKDLKILLTTGKYTELASKLQPLIDLLGDKRGSPVARTNVADQGIPEPRLDACVHISAHMFPIGRKNLFDEAGKFLKPDHWLLVLDKAMHTMCCDRQLRPLRDLFARPRHHTLLCAPSCTDDRNHESQCPRAYWQALPPGHGRRRGWPHQLPGTHAQSCRVASSTPILPQ